MNGNHRKIIFPLSFLLINLKMEVIISLNNHGSNFCLKKTLFKNE